MQAIISDIIVNQSAQSGNLQVSQLIKDNSSPQTSFMDMLNALRSQETDAPEKESALKTSYEDKKASDISEPGVESKTKDLEKTEDKKDLLEAKENPEEKKNIRVKADKSENLVEDTGKKNPFIKEAGTSPKLLNAEGLEKTQAKDSKKAADNSKIKNLADKNKLQKNPVEKNLNIAANEELADLTEVQENSALQNALENQISKSESKVETNELNKENALEIDSNNISLTENHNDFAHNKLSADEKVFALDKEGKIIVHDQRTVIADENKPVEKNNSKSQVQLKLYNQNNATITMELAQQNVSENILSLDNQTAASDGSNFQAMLSNQISQNASEIVKSGSIILKDNNQGTINLVLHPDDLGNVKIHLSMDGKTLSGHIAVTTKEALQVFKDNAETLREAFIKNGFDVSNFDVSLSNGSFAEHNSQEFLQDESSNYFAKRVYESSVDDFSENSANYAEKFLENSNYSINIVA